LGTAAGRIAWFSCFSTLSFVLVYFGQEPTGGIVASKLAIAALFDPLRRRIQELRDRRFYRRKYDVARKLRAFSSKLGEETDLNRQSGELVSVVGETMHPVAGANGKKAR